MRKVIGLLVFFALGFFPCAGALCRVAPSSTFFMVIHSSGWNAMASTSGLFHDAIRAIQRSRMRLGLHTIKSHFRLSMTYLD